MTTLPERFVARVRAALGKEAEDYFAALDAPPSHGLHINVRKCCAEEVDSAFDLREILPGAPVRRVLSGRPSAHPFHAAGLYYMQEPSAMLPVSALDVPEGARVLDMCASPGGKSSQLACALRGGLLVSNEIDRSRAEILRENIVRMGYDNVTVLSMRPDRIASLFGGFFDVVVVDAPCSGEGMIRKEPQVLRDLTDAGIRACASRQRSILESAAACLREGGTLLYSTCTFAPEEDEDNAEYILSLGFETLPVPPEIASEGREARLGVKFMPHFFEGEGQYFCLFRKTSPAACVMHEKKRAFREASARALRALDEVLDVRGLNVCERDGMLFAPALFSDLPCLVNGVMLGHMEKDGRFTPSHQLFTALGDRCRSVLSLAPDDPRVAEYLAGREIAGDVRGRCAVAVNGHALGGGKGSGGVVKNNYPKNLRTH